MKEVVLPNGKRVTLDRLNNHTQRRLRRGGKFIDRRKYSRQNSNQELEEALDDWENHITD